MSSTFDLHIGTPADTGDIASLMCAAGSGLFEQLFEDVVPGFPVESLLALAINDPDTAYYFENALLAEHCGTNAGMMLGFPASQFELPRAALDFIPPERLAPLREMLESRIEGSFYVNSLAVRPGFARRGLARLLLNAAALLGQGEGHDSISLHVWSDNEPAMALYRGLGFEFRRSMAIAPSPRLRHRGPVLLGSVAIEKLLDA